MIGRAIIAAAALVFSLAGLACALLLILLKWMEAHPEDYTIEDEYND